MLAFHLVLCVMPSLAIGKGAGLMDLPGEVILEKPTIFGTLTILVNAEGNGWNWQYIGECGAPDNLQTTQKFEAEGMRSEEPNVTVAKFQRATAEEVADSLNGQVVSWPSETPAPCYNGKHPRGQWIIVIHRVLVKTDTTFTAKAALLNYDFSHAP